MLQSLSIHHLELNQDLICGRYYCMIFKHLLSLLSHLYQRIPTLNLLNIMYILIFPQAVERTTQVHLVHCTQKFSSSKYTVSVHSDGTLPLSGQFKSSGIRECQLFTIEHPGQASPGYYAIYNSTQQYLRGQDRNRLWAFIIDEDICHNCLQSSADNLVITIMVITTGLVLLQAHYEHVIWLPLSCFSLRSPSSGGICLGCWEETF